VKLTARIAATFSRSGAARDNAVGDAVETVVFRDSKGTSAPASARMGRAAVVIALALTGLTVAASPALAATPEVKIDPTVAATYSSVEVSGEVDPKGDPLVWFVQISTDEGASWREGFEFGESPIGEISEEEANEPKSLTNLIQKGLTPGATYQVRLAIFDFITNELIGSPGVEFTTKAPPAPSVTLDPITDRTDTTAVLKGKVDPNSPGGLDEEEKTFYATEYAFHCSPECPGLSGGTVPAEANGSELEVEAHPTNLEPNTEYTVTLSATSKGGKVTAAPQTFTTSTSSPTVATGPGTSKTPGTFTIEGTVNPHNTAIVSCQFDWGPTASYGHVVPCEPMPTGGNSPVFVTAALSGLTIGAEYHFRIFASNGVGSPVSTPDATFVAHEPCTNEAIREEQGSTYLPECRAYEQVTPAFKEAFPPTPTGFAEGELAYGSSGNYAENGNGTASLNGGNAYLSIRTGSGWSIEALAPSGPGYYTYTQAPRSLPKATSSDLASTLWEMRRGDQTNAVSDLYVRHPDGVFARIGSALDPLSPSSAAGVVVASDDLSHVAFNAVVSNTAGTDVYEYIGGGEGQPRRVDVDNDGQPIGPPCPTPIGGTGSRHHAISTDGRVIFFTRQCGTSAIYARVDGTTTVDASESQCTRACSEGSEPIFQGADADGTRMYFSTTAQLVDGDTDETNDLYECDIPPGTLSAVGAVNPCPDLREVSGAAAGAGVQGVTGISEDGSRAYFVATGVLASNPAADGAQAVAGDDNLYVWTRDAGHPAGATQFVAKLDQADAPGAVSGGLWGSERLGRLAQTTDDGRYLIFASYAQLIDHGPQADTDTARDVYRYDAVTGALTRLSTDTGGEGGNAQGQDAGFIPIASANENASSVPADRTAMSDDGGSVVFTTSEALSPNDTNGTVDAYLWHDGHVSLISSGKPSSDGFFEGGGDTPFGTSNLVQALISPSGRDVYFTTTARLVSSDTDTVMDVYDARVDGGFATSEPTQCTGESCRPPASPPVTSQGSATQTLGAGNQLNSRRCPKGKVRKHGRCVKKHGKKRHAADKQRQSKKHRHSANDHRHAAKHPSAVNEGGRK
jgi:hypothetical protein